MPKLRFVDRRTQHRKNVESILKRLQRLPNKYTEEVMIEVGVSRIGKVTDLRRHLIEHNAERVYLIDKSLAAIEKQRRTKGIRYR